MGSPKKYTKEFVSEAIVGSGGIMSTIAKKLGCGWSTADKYVKKWEETRLVYAEEEETVLDMAEGTVLKSIKEGNTQDAKWFLSKKGIRRGYAEKIEEAIDNMEAMTTFFKKIMNNETATTGE